MKVEGRYQFHMTARSRTNILEEKNETYCFIFNKRMEKRLVSLLTSDTVKVVIDYNY